MAGGYVMEQKEFEKLVERFLQETISADELQLLMGEIKAGRNLNTLDNAIAEQLSAKAFCGLCAGVGEEEMFQKTMQRAAAYEKPATAKVVALPTRKKYPATALFRVSAAAVILLLCLTAAYLLFINKRGLPGDTKTALKNDIAPGGNKATLTLADGNVVVLNDQQNGTLSSQGNTKIIKLTEGKVAYNAANTGSVQTAFNTISTPRGGKYQVVLADGTNVWLNAASSIRFPTAFTGKERTVEITGEAYFEVAKNKAMPFKVKASTVQVEVLGTHFNVMAYTDEAASKTTLLEGSVKISSSGRQTIIAPGQQASVARGSNSINVLDGVDLDETVAWKNGMFMFNNTGIETIMRQIARWYDVEVSYDGPVTTDHFTGKVSRNSTAAQVLKILELSDIHFTISGKKIIVKS